jgi:hypothetical protein
MQITISHVLIVLLWVTYSCGGTSYGNRIRAGRDFGIGSDSRGRNSGCDGYRAGDAYSRRHHRRRASYRAYMGNRRPRNRNSHRLCFWVGQLNDLFVIDPDMLGARNALREIGQCLALPCGRGGRHKRAGDLFGASFAPLFCRATSGGPGPRVVHKSA